MRTPIITLVVCAGALVAPGLAQAASISYEGNQLVYRAAPGERNSFSLYPDQNNSASGKVEISDAYNVAISYPAGPCEQPFEGTVLCTYPAGGLVADLGDGDDSAGFGSSLPASVKATILGGPGKDDLHAYGATNPILDGGDGSDTLTGWQSNDTLRGGAGDDELLGHGGDDVLQGGDGNDKLQPDTYDDPGNDVVDGGPGIDTADDWTDPELDYNPPVSITMDGVANDGRPGEADNVTNVENLKSSVTGTFVGGPEANNFEVWNVSQGVSRLVGNGGDDVLTGNNAEETIDGGPGNDRLEGGYNNDTIGGGPGRDTIYGDDTSSQCGYIQSCTVPFGNDTIDAQDGEADVVDCGVGDDTAKVDAIDVVSGCEHVSTSAGGGSSGGAGGAAGGLAFTLGGKASIRTLARKGLTLSVACPAACTASAALTVDKATARRLHATRIGGGSERLRKAGAAKVALKLSRKVKARFKRLRKATVTVTVTVKGADGTKRTGSKTLKLSR
jgi:Ca2+-binding RTX toxin-like protein